MGSRIELPAPPPEYDPYEECVHLDYNPRHGRSISVRKTYVLLTRDYHAAVMLAQGIFHMHLKTDSNINGWKAFYLTMDDWEDETVLTRKQQSAAREILCQLVSPDGTRIWIEKLQGTPAKLYYRVNITALDAAIDALEIPA